MYKFQSEADKLLNDYINDMLNKGTKPKSYFNRKFYETKINRFFLEFMSTDENCNRPLNDITSYDINTYLSNLKKDKRNNYSALNAFFNFCYKNNYILRDVMKDVTKPVRSPSKTEYITKQDLDEFIKFTANRSEPILDRLLIGFLLYTGLSRGNIANIRNADICTKNTENTLQFYNNKSITIIPIKKELMDIIEEYWDTNYKSVVPQQEKLINLNVSYINDKVKKISKCKLKSQNIYIPNQFSYTFIKNCIDNNCDVYVISQLVLKKEDAITKHITAGDTLFNREKEVLSHLYSE